MKWLLFATVLKEEMPFIKFGKKIRLKKMRKALVDMWLRSIFSMQNVCQYSSYSPSAKVTLLRTEQKVISIELVAFLSSFWKFVQRQWEVYDLGNILNVEKY